MIRDQTRIRLIVLFTNVASTISFRVAFGWKDSEKTDGCQALAHKYRSYFSRANTYCCIVIIHLSSNNRQTARYTIGKCQLKRTLWHINHLESTGLCNHDGNESVVPDRSIGLSGGLLFVGPYSQSPLVIGASGDVESRGVLELRT
jgi:hypothetical protein